MESLSSTAPAALPLSGVLPRWVLSRGPEMTEADAAFASGAALNSLDNLVRAAPVWAGCWRARLTLKCAASAVRLMGRTEDEAALRDAVLLVAPGDDPGPAGRVFLAYKWLGGRTKTINTKTLRDLVDLMALRWDDQFAEVPNLFDDAMQSGRAAPFVAAELVTKICHMRPDAEVLAWGLADRLLAERLSWERPVPLLMGERYGSAFRTIGGRGRVRSGEEGFGRAVCLALTSGTADALRLAAEIGRRADRLLAVAPKVRTKGADAVIRQLLSEDSVSASAPGANLSRWASRRLFERLESFDAVREFSGRQSFRIYGV